MWKDVKESPAQNGWYVVWRMADEGESFAPAEWNGIEPWGMAHGRPATGVSSNGGMKYSRTQRWLNSGR